VRYDREESGGPGDAGVEGIVSQCRENQIPLFLKNNLLKYYPEGAQERLAIFIDGCFWHGCPKCHIEPKSNIDYWLPKINRNKKRDKAVNAELKRRGWTVVRFWEHSLKRPKLVLKKLQKNL